MASGTGDTAGGDPSGVANPMPKPIPARPLWLVMVCGEHAGLYHAECGDACGCVVDRDSGGCVEAAAELRLLLLPRLCGGMKLTGGKAADD